MTITCRNPPRPRLQQPTSSTYLAHCSGLHWTCGNVIIVIVVFIMVVIIVIVIWHIVAGTIELVVQFSPPSPSLLISGENLF